MDNATTARLAAGEPAVGAWVLSLSQRAAEAIAPRLDWVGIDTEHAPADGETVEALIRAVERAATPIVRLPSLTAAAGGAAKRALDSGARGVIVPDVQSREDAERAAAAARFPPAGERGVAGATRANRYGEVFDEDVAAANAGTLLVVQLESPAAIERADEILGVEGIDVAFVGENDLSASLGHPGETARPAVEDSIEAVLDAARQNDVYPGISGKSPDDLAERINEGWRFLLLGSDLGFMRDGVDALLDTAGRGLRNRGDE